MAVKAATNGRASKHTPVELEPLDIQEFDVRIESMTPLLVNRFSDKARREIADKGPKKKRVIESPEEQYKGSLYRHPDGGYGFPAAAFKKAAIRAAKVVGMYMTDAATGGWQIMGMSDGEVDLIKIEGEPEMHSSIVRVSGKASPRYRGIFHEWSATLTVMHNARSTSRAQIISLLEHAGFHVGVGENRPEKTGSNGMFRIMRKGGE